MQYLSELTTQASGSAGGLTASRNQYVRYLRARTTPVDPSTPAQRTMRSRFRVMSGWWLGLLGQARRDAWDVYAANVTMTNALGDPCHWTGRHHFFAANLVRTFATPPALSILDAPTVFNRSANAPPTFSLFLPTRKILIHYDMTDGWINQNQGFMLVYMSPYLTKSVNFYKGPYSFAIFIQGDAIFPPPSPQTVAVYGFVTPLTRWFFRTITTRTDGRVALEHRTFLDVVP